MSSTAFAVVDGKETDISITKFCHKPGQMAYQVTWKSSDKEHLFDYVSFENWIDAKVFVQLLEARIR